MRPSRRQILAGAAAGTLAYGLGSARAAGTRESMIIVNALGGIENPNLALTRPQSDNPVETGKPDIDARALKDLHASGVTAVNITLGYVGGPDDPYAYSLDTIDTWDAALADNDADLMKVLKAGDILEAKKSGKIGVIYGFQNGAMMGDDVERVDTFADLGVRIFQLTYNPANQLGDGAMAPENRGLTSFGRAVVEKLNARRMMVDLSHSGEKTCLDAAHLSKAPISINHTGCRALCDMPRNKTDEELKLVASKGGFIGIYFMPFLKADSHPHAEDVVAHIDHAVNVCGEDHVGIGTDGDVSGIDDMDRYRAFAAKQIADRRKAGLGATGETPDTYPFVIDLRGQDQFRKLIGLLEKKGYSGARIEKIMGRNFLRFAEEVWG
ncbi:MAG: peptidase M19 [Alphaproteobacteria bacterium]|nr:peptidase M19 [Alphaproteobacteria bacterium]